MMLSERPAAGVFTSSHLTPVHASAQLKYTARVIALAQLNYTARACVLPIGNPTPL